MLTQCLLHDFKRMGVSTCQKDEEHLQEFKEDIEGAFVGTSVDNTAGIAEDIYDDILSLNGM